MTRRQLIRLTEGWARALGLGEWRIEVRFAELEDNLAEVDYGVLKRWATITYDPDALAREEEEVVATIVHELLHLMLVPLTSVAERLHGHEDGEAKRVYREALLLAEEVIVDRLAHAIAS